MVQVSDSDFQSRINIRTSEDFVPRAGLIHRIRAALHWIDPVDLEGIDFVFLFEKVPLVTQGKNRDLDAALHDGLLLFAAYNHRDTQWPAHIILIAENLYKPIPPALHRSPALTLWLAENIAHEVGHHLIVEKRFARRCRKDGQVEDEEEFADNYAASVVTKMLSKPRYRFARFLLGIAAQTNYVKGARHWKKTNYDDAAEYFYLTTQLRRDHKDASYWYWKAKEKAEVSF